MVEPREPLTERPRRRPRPSRRTLVTRRLVASALVLAGLAALAWIGVKAVDAVRGDDAPKALPPPKPVILKIVFPEGFTRRDMADRIADVNGIAQRKRHVETRLSPSAYLRLTAHSSFPHRFDPTAKTQSLEGFLFPALYDFTPRTRTKELVKLQLKTFRRFWKKIDLSYARRHNLTPYDVLRIASMVQVEVRAPEERRLVSAVIYNRLRRNMPLGIDATIRYALHVPYTKPLLDSHLANRTPYNSRLFPGLPPTPISNPGLASLEAAAHPAAVNYLYFVRKPDKIHHFFTASYQEFNDYAIAHGYGG